MSQCKKRVEGLRPPKITLCWKHVQTKAQSLKELRKYFALRMESSSSESETGNRKASHSGVSLKRVRSKTEPVDFNDGQRCVSAVSQCEETEEILHPPESTLSGEDDVQTKAQSIEQLRKDIALTMKSSGSESETGSGNASDSGVSSKRSKEELNNFKIRQSWSVESDSEVSYKNDGSDDNLWFPLRVLLRPIGSSGVSVLGDCSERQRRHSFPQRRRRHEDAEAF